MASRLNWIFSKIKMWMRLVKSLFETIYILNTNMSEYPYEDKIHSTDRVNYKTVFSSDGIKIGKVEAAFGESFIVKLEKEDTEIKYQIPRLEIASITGHRITLKLKQGEIDQKYQTSSIEKSPK